MAGDEIYTIDELIKRRSSELKTSPLFGFPKEGPNDYEEHSAEAVDRYVDAAVEILQQRGVKPVDSQLDQAPVVGILASSSLEFIIALLGLSRLGYAVLLLSTRLASPAILRLLQLAECDTILTTSHFHHVLAEVQSQQHITVLEMLKHDDYYGVPAPVFHRTYDAEKEFRKRAVIIHSSGSTGLPKPIYLTHRSCIAAFATNLDRRALMTQPLFHSFGFYETFRSVYSGKPIYYVNYNLPLTKQNLLDTIRQVKPELLFCVPYVLKLLAESDEGIRCLADIDLIMYGGSACPDDLGDKLVKNGVNVTANYGATETGRVMTSVRPPGDLAWNYLRILPQVKQFLLMDEIAPGIYECVALDGLPSKSTINSNDPPNSFRTSDLFTRHPSNPEFWKYVSRLDDRLTLMNGEKVLPIPIEGRIRQESLVKEAIVFGNGKTIPGILIIKADAASSLSDEEFLQHIWPAVEDANARAESFSQIPRELVVILPSDTSYACTDKSTFIRAQIYAQFEQQIEDAYANFENDTGGTISLSPPELEAYLLQRFSENLDVALDSPETDFFSFGIDSLQCMRMWSLIKKEIDLGGRQSELGQNVLYETGNIRALARHLDGLRRGALDESQDQQQVMNDLVAKYSSFQTFNHRQPEKHVVILTGVTGGLGAHLLAQLLQNPNVSEVWALVRASSDLAALERTLKSLSTREINPPLDQLRKLVAVSSDLSKSDFGLGPNKLEELRSKLSLVIHSAWAVNFNISVQSFEAQHIRAVQNLVNFCQSTSYASPARFFFCSSVSSAGGTPRPGTVREAPIADISHVQGTGYARSKYVAEQIVRNAAKNAGANANVLRIGQLIGDTQIGAWNTTEGIPLMIQTAITLGALPALDEEMTWLPVDYAARIILDICDITDTPPAPHSTVRNADPNLVCHVLNPTRFHWTRDMLPALSAAGLNFETLPTDQWMDRLRNSNRDPKQNPPIKLLEWFESKYSVGASSANKGALAFSTEETRRRSETLGRVPDVTNAEYVSLLVGWLRRQWGV